jgi:hypothetical protein
MARIIQMVDDLDGSPADQTKTFVWEGYEYHLDLTDPNTEKLRADLAPWIAAAHHKVKVNVTEKNPKGVKDAPVGETVGHPPKGKSTGGGSIKSPEGETKEHRLIMRQWASLNGFHVQERGIIGTEIREAYNKAHNLGPGVGITSPIPLPRQQLQLVEDPTKPNANGITPEMREWARANDIPMTRGYLKREHQDQFWAEKLGNVHQESGVAK